MDSEYIKEHNYLMTPKHMSTLEGQQVYFSNLHEKMLDKAELEEGELNDSNTPREKELDILTGQVKGPDPIKLEGPEFKQKIKDFLQKLNGNEEVTSNDFHEAKEELYASVKKKEVKSKKKVVKIDSEDEVSSNDSHFQVFHP